MHQIYDNGFQGVLREIILVIPAGTECGPGDGIIQNIYRFGPDLGIDGMADYTGILVDEDIVYKDYLAGGVLTADSFDPDTVAKIAQLNNGDAPTVDAIVEYVVNSGSGIFDSTFVIDAEDKIPDTYYGNNAVRVAAKMVPGVNVDITANFSQTYSCAATIAADPDKQDIAAPTNTITYKAKWQMLQNKWSPVPYMQVTSP